MINLILNLTRKERQENLVKESTKIKKYACKIEDSRYKEQQSLKKSIIIDWMNWTLFS